MAGERIKPIATESYSSSFENKFSRFLCKTESTNWEYEIKLFLHGAKKWAKGSNLLDIGCGTGFLPLCFYKFGYKCWGVDFDPVQIESAKKWQKKLKCDDVIFEQAEIENIPFNDGFFDMTTSKDVVEHLPDSVLKNYLEQSHRFLKEEGILMIFTKPTKYTYLFRKQYSLLLFPFIFTNEPLILKYLSFLNNIIPRLYKKITGCKMVDTWQDEAPCHCNCPELKDLSKKVENANFELIVSKALIRPDQTYFKFLYRIFPFQVVKPNIFIIARKKI